MPPKYAGAFANVFLRKRARAAAKLGKPYMLEGVGMVRKPRGLMLSPCTWQCPAGAG